MRSFSLLGGRVQGIRLGQGSPVLALHGFLDNAMSFKPLSEHLKGRELWALDLPGHGRSEPLAQADGWTLMHWMPVLGQILDELDWPQFELLGHSLGAILAQMLASLDERIVQLICLDALGPMTDTDTGNLDRLQGYYQRRHQSRAQRRYYTRIDDLWHARTKGRFPLSEPSARLMSSRGIGMNQQGWFHRYDAKLRDPSLWRMTESQMLALLQRIRCPLHLAVFSDSPLSSAMTGGQPRLAAVPQLHRQDFPGGHHAHMETPVAIADWINAIGSPAISSYTASD